VIFNFLKEPIQRKLIYIILITFLGLAGTAVLRVFYFNRNLKKLELNERNQIAKQEIGELIQHEMMKMHHDIAHFIIKIDSKKIPYYDKQISQSNKKINDLLKVLQSGGVFTNSFKVNFDDKTEISTIIKYKKSLNDGFVLEVIDLFPKIVEINEKIEKIFETEKNLAKAKNLEEKQSNLDLFSTLEKHIHTLFVRCNEIENKIILDANIELQKIRQTKLEYKKKATLILIKVKITVMLFILFVSFFIIVQIKKYIQKITIENKERQHAEYALFKSEKKYKFLISEIPDVVWSASQSGEMNYISPNIEKIYGYSPKEIYKTKGRLFFDKIHPDDNNNIKKLYSLLFTEGKRFDVEYRIKRKDGKWIWLHDRATSVYDEKGIKYATGLFSDITNKKLSEEKLKNSEQRNAALLNAIPDVMFVHDNNGVFLDYSASSFDNLFFQPEDFLGKNIKDIMPENVSTPAIAALKEAIKTGKSRVFEYSLSIGNIFKYFEARYAVCGKNKVLAIVRDISERKIAEITLEKSEEKERELNKKLTLLYEVSTRLSNCSNENDLWKLAVELGREKLGFDRLGIWLTTNKKGELRGVFGTSLKGELIDETDLKGQSNPNSAVDRTLDLKTACLYSKNEEVMNDEITEVIGYSERAVAPLWNGTKTIGIISMDNFILHKPITENDRSLLALYASFLGHFATRLRTTEKQINLERQVQHTQKLKSLGVLAGGIAHDFNNILMGVLGYTDLTLKELPPHSPVKNNLMEINKAACRAADLAKQMLAYSGRGKFIIESISLNNFIKEMVHILEVSISKKIILKYNFSNNLPTFKGDATQIRQIIMNLITNASESIEGKSGVISISTGAVFCDREYLNLTSSSFIDNFDKPLAEGTYVYIEVSDTGCGMDEDIKAKIFDPFFTTKFSGQGLGMAAVLGIVRGHKGAIKLQSVKGKGTTFKILFPANSQSDDSKFPKLSLKKEQQYWKGNGSFLIADDEETICAIGKHILEKLGFDVLIAEDGKKAVELFQKNADDIVCVLLDLSMPYLNGEEVFSRMKAIKPDVKVILSSGYNEQDITQKFAEKGLVGFIQKPYVSKVLINKVKEIFDNK